MEFYRGVLVILFLEIIVFIHYLSKWFFPFEFYLNLFDFFMTVGGIYAVIRHMIKTIRKG